MARVPGIGTATRFFADRSFDIGAALLQAAWPEGSDREQLRARAQDALDRAWQASLDILIPAGLIERTADRLLSEGVLERIAERVLKGGELDRVVAQSLDSGRSEELVELVIARPATDRLVARIVDSPGFERLVLSVAHSELFDRLLERILRSEELDRVVSQIAESDEVREALTQQTTGLADEVAGELRTRTEAADALLERFARALIRRRPAPGSGQAGGSS